MVKCQPLRIIQNETCLSAAVATWLRECFEPVQDLRNEVVRPSHMPILEFVLNAWNVAAPALTAANS